MIVADSSKEFENPETGDFVGTVIDVVDVGKKVSYGKEKVRVRVVWVLNANDSTGQPFRVMNTVNAVVTDKPKKSRLYEIAESVLGTAPSVPFDTDILIGKSNKLIIMREKDSKSGNVYANIKAILPLPAGTAGPAIPTGFVRAQDRQTQPTNGAPAVQAQQQAPVQAVGQAILAIQTPPNAAPVATTAPQPAQGTPVPDAAF